MLFFFHSDNLKIRRHGKSIYEKFRFVKPRDKRSENQSQVLRLEIIHEKHLRQISRISGIHRWSIHHPIEWFFYEFTGYVDSPMNCIVGSDSYKQTMYSRI